MFKNILLPLDGSRFSELARPLARRIANAARAKLHVVHVRTTAEGQKDSAAIARSLERYVADLAIDLIVMATHARSGLQHAVSGSVADETIRLIRVPILLLHAQSAEAEVTTQPEEIHRIVVPLDGTAEAERILPAATELARIIGAQITVARVDAPTSNPQRTADNILRCSDSVAADAIALAVPAATGWSRIAEGNVAQTVLQRAAVPVLILRP